MAKHSRIAVLDIGKTNIKTVVFDLASEREIDVISKPNAPLPGPPYRHFDTEAIWNFFRESLATLHERHGFEAISITTHGACFVLLDENGELAMPVLDYEDTGPDELADVYNAIRPKFSETGSPRLPMGLNVGAQLHYLATTFPDAFARARWCLPYPQYWAFRLTGEIASETTSLGVHTDLWNPYANTYSSMVGELGWTRLMPPIKPASAILGPLKSDLTAALGLPSGLPVYSGIHDSNASLLPHLIARQTPFSVVSTGTWVIVMSMGGRQVALDEARDTLINVNALGGPVPSSRFMGGRAFELSGADSRAEITAADRQRVLGEKVVLLPSLPAGSGPFPDKAARWSVAPEALTPGEKLLVVSLYLALMTNVSLDLTGAEGPVVVEGPFSRNEAYLDMLAQLRGTRPLKGDSGLTGTSYGAACLATLESATAASKSGTMTAKPVEPDPLLLEYASAWNTRA